MTYCSDRSRPHTMDLISALPDSIVHHIMSSLTTSEVTRLSIVSKRFFSLWCSFPVIELDQNVFSTTYNKGTRVSIVTNAFLDHVLNSVRLRTNNGSTTGFSEIFRVNANLDSKTLSDHRLDLAILMVVANGVRCMELNLGFGKEYLLPTDFASNSMTVLRLKGLQLDLSHLIQVCPSLRALSLTSCTIPQDVDFSSETLTEIELRECGVIIKSIKINAPNLQSFVFSGGHFKNNKPCQIDVLGCENIAYLSVSNVTNGDWIEKHVHGLSKLKTFLLSRCQDIESIRVWNEKLERVEISCCHQLTSVELIAKSLESFVYNHAAYSDIFCNITFGLSSNHVKDLSIKGGLLNDEWLEAQLAIMTRLEKLRLKSCKSLRKIKVCHEKLQILELDSCIGMVEAEIDTPQLVSFVYHGNMIRFDKMVTRSSCTATLSMKPWTAYDDDSFCRWRDLLSFFGHCKTLKLICSDYKEVMIPELVRERLVSPLYDLQHLEIQIKSLEKIDIDLVDSLLWLSPLPKILHISSVSGSASRLEMIIKFGYNIVTIEGEEADNNPFCCQTKRIKCWKHHLKRLEIQSDNYVTPSNESIELHKYFLTNTNIQDSLICFSFKSII